jgi:hypothetical protein
MKHVNLDNPECPGDKTTSPGDNMTSPSPSGGGIKTTPKGNGNGNGGIKTTPKGNGAIFTVNIVLLVLAMTSSHLFF